MFTRGYEWIYVVMKQLTQPSEIHSDIGETGRPSNNPPETSKAGSSSKFMVKFMV